MAIPIAFYANMMYVVTIYAGGSLTPSLILFIAIHTISFLIVGIAPYSALQYFFFVILMSVLFSVLGWLTVHLVYGSLPWMFVFRNMSHKPPKLQCETDKVYAEKWQGKFLGIWYFVRSTIAMVLSVVVYLPAAFLYSGLSGGSYDTTTQTIAALLPLALILLCNWIAYHLLKWNAVGPNKPWERWTHLLWFIVFTLGLVQLLFMYTLLLLPDVIRADWVSGTAGLYILPPVCLMAILIYHSVCGLCLRHLRKGSIVRKWYPYKKKKKKKKEEKKEKK